MSGLELSAAIFVAGFFLCCLIYVYCDIRELGRREADAWRREWLLAESKPAEEDAAA